MLANPEKDSRLYMTFPIDTHRHPKFRRLSPEAKWAFFEMNGEARLEDNDGVFDAEEAEFLWGADVLDALVKSHPSRPLVVREGDKYVIREYAKHQLTRADRERMSAERSEQARRAANARWSKRGASSEHAGSMHAASGEHAESCQQSQSQSQSQTYDLTSIKSQSVSQERNAREILTDAEETPEQVEGSKRLADGIGVNLGKVIERAEGIDRSLTHGQALRLATIILAKSKRQPPGNPMGYIATTFRNSPLEVQQWIDREVIV